MVTCLIIYRTHVKKQVFRTPFSVDRISQTVCIQPNLSCYQGSSIDAKSDLNMGCSTICKTIRATIRPESWHRGIGTNPIVYLIFCLCQG